MPMPSMHVAVLDDEPQIRKALGRLLRSYGYDVSDFADGSSFLNSCRNTRYDALLLDLHMPGMNGFDVLKSLQHIHSPPVAIVITGHDIPGCADHARELGAAECFLKPIDQQVLLDAIARFIDASEQTPTPIRR
jgi:FixJ family two-component response regulator